MRRHITTAACLSLLAIPALAAKPATTTAPATRPAAAKPDKPAQRVVKVKDQLHVELVDLTPGVTTTFTAAVDAKGAIRVPVLGNVQAAGRTAGQLEQDIKDAYEKKGLVRGMSVAVEFTDAPI
jgi:protein involved in polysaccharide export with SLBB domain